jgi:MoaA/NifB/PqqE/SkfB family radical SAM enzyme
MHDSLTRTRGSFEQTLAGIDNVVSLRVSHPVRLVTSTVVTRRNLARVGRIIEFLGGRGVDTLVLNVVEPSGEALDHFETLAPRYEEIAGHIRMAVEGSEFREKVVVEGIPLCLCRDFLDCTGVREQIHLLEGSDIKALPTDRNHVKTGRCEGCDLTALCPGVFAEYVKRRGWN